MQGEEDAILWEGGYVDWKKKPAKKGQHGGMRAALFVLVVEVMENLAYLANASNLVLYLTQHMHFSLSKAANNVTDFMGTAFLLALLGGFLSDAFFTAYQIYIFSASLEFLGLVILTIQARSSWLQPPECKKESCEQVQGGEAAMLFLGLYLVALGVGGIKGSLPVHGADQFDENDIKGRKQRSTFFNYFVFCLAIGALIAVTFVVWMEDNKGWVWGFGISMLTIFLSIPVFLAGSCFYRNKLPSGSPLTTIFKVVVASMLNTCVVRSPGNASIKPQQDEETTKPTAETPSLSLKFLNRAAINKPACKFLQCSVLQVEDVKIVLKVLPIFGCTIMLNCCLAQLSTFTVQQAATMNTKIGNLKVPPASLPVFPVVFIILLAPIYDHIIVPFARKTTKSEMGISHLQRIGIGLLLSIVAMAIAALVEIKRKRVATKAGLLEFFFTEAPCQS
nr:protein NRT1/ PTR FAMILY 4.6 [Tanacetum cinerariifolium]